MVARHPGLVAFALGVAAGTLLIVVQPHWTGLPVDVLNVALRYWFVGIPMVVVGWAARRFVAGAGPGWVALQVIGALQIGFFLGFLIVGYVTCAFCLS